MSVFLAHDDYDMVPAEKKLSVTTLLRSVRQVILGSRAVATDSVVEDVSGLIPARLGSAIHAAVEHAWKEPQASLKALGYPQRVIDRVKMNPTEWEPEDHAIWIELRTEKEFEGFVISGSADAIMNGAVHDVKSTGIFAYTTGSNNLKYRLQLSMYRWLNQDKVTSDEGYIEYYFKDWNKLEAGYKQGYPAFPILKQPLPLLSVTDTEKYMKDKINLLKESWDLPETELPDCTSEDLWQDKPKWQYFSKPMNQKASKNFATELEASQWRNAKGVGEVRFKVGKAKACSYCNAAPKCSMYARLKANGLAD